ncbi:hypothetical protein HPB47_027968 [Ixodes persulcatus]|uniref:Uncharacterized protein n=1 Tax=Ixodes persulcatus TaxID=34615 RepID=A0AC60PWE3_IXOPE|nr:hypothetical protein HPB47_027968 [Ixodes persulcatus]
MQVRATYKYTAEDVDELNFESGEIIRVIEYDDPEEQVRCLNSPAQSFQLRSYGSQGLQKAQRPLVNRLSPRLPVGAPGSVGLCNATSP